MLNLNRKEKAAVGVLAATATVFGLGLWGRQGFPVETPPSIAPINAEGVTELPAGEEEKIIPATVAKQKQQPVVVAKINHNKTEVERKSSVPPQQKETRKPESSTEPGLTEPESSREKKKENTHPVKFKNAGDGRVNLNTAGSEELQRLPGIGPATAEKILLYRQEIGNFTDLQQIQDVKGIGPKKFAKIEPFLTLE